MSARLAFFGDLHLSNLKEDIIRESFYHTLNKLIDENYTHIVLMGDIFDLFVGPKVFWKKLHSEFFDLLNRASRKNIKLIWIEGNHDFHLKALFKEYSNLNYVEEDFDLVVNDKKIYLSHGDTVNSRETDYLRWRQITKSKLFRRFIDFIPSRLGEWALLPLAELASKSSRKRSRYSLEQKVIDLYKEFSQKKIAHGYTAVVLGHNHSFAFEVFSENNFYLNLGAPESQSFKYASWDTGKEKLPSIKTVSY